jgi:fatty-acyl-CoA synthase
MKFAFSSVCAPTWDFPTLVSRAKEYGYDGVEIRALTDRSAGNPFLSDPDKIRSVFDSSAIEICCLASSIAMTQNKKKDAEAADELRLYIDTAQKLGCPIVKIFDTQVKPGWSRASTGVLLGDWLLPLADYAADHDVIIGIENALSFRMAKEMWSIVDRVNHPSIGVAWDLMNAAMIGEFAAYSIPTLNSKIVYTQVKDAKLGALGITYTKLGEGDAQVRNFMRRLRGVGYDGYVTLEWEKAWLPNLLGPEEILPDSIKKLKDWDQKLETSDWEADAEAKKPPKPAPAAAKH